MFLDEFDHIIKISIHALREEGDAGSYPAAFKRSNFYPRPPRGGRRCTRPEHRAHQDISIHALREEGDGARRHQRGGLHIFLSTPSARRATVQLFGDGQGVAISIHALREEGDSKNRDKSSIFKQIIQHSARI